MVKTKKNDFVELEFLGRVKGGEVFDTNISREAKKIGMSLSEKPLILCIGKEMVIKGFDAALNDKEIGKKYDIELDPEEAFGERKGSLVKLIPLNAFTKQNISPKPGMTLNLDNMVVRIASVSGGRVLVDFNNPLAGKQITYEFTIKKQVNDDKAKIQALIDYFIKQPVKFELKDKKAILDIQEVYAPLLDMVNKEFKEILGVELQIKKQPKKTAEKPNKDKNK